MTVEDARKELLQQLDSMVSYWANQKDASLNDKLRGVVFSFLVIIDGESVLPSFELIPNSHKDDEIQWPNVDISDGELHSMWARAQYRDYVG